MRLEIFDIIKILNPSNKALGPVIISHKMLKLCSEKIAVPLQIIFNKSLLQCKYPTSWKIAHVIAIYKKGDKSLPSNNRPISLISCVEKIMERVIYKYAFSHLQRNKLISPKIFNSTPTIRNVQLHSKFSRTNGNKGPTI
jgi:hypothetical protein